MLQKFAVALLMAGLTVIAAADDTVYKWSDSHGQIHYTDLPPNQSDAKVLGIFRQESSVMDDETGDEGDGANNGDNGNETTQPSANDSNEPTIDNQAMADVQRDVANAKAAQCKEAQERYQRYIESRRLFRVTPEGEREYLTDKELDEARVRAKQTVADYCG
jgi:catalase